MSNKNETTEIFSTERATGNDFFGRALLQMLIEAIPDKKEFQKFVETSNQKLEIKASINGVDVKLSDFVNFLEENWSFSVKKAAEKMIEEKFSQNQNEINDLLEGVKQTIKDKAKEHNLDIFKSDYDY